MTLTCPKCFDLAPAAASHCPGCGANLLVTQIKWPKNFDRAEEPNLGGKRSSAQEVTV